MEARRPDLILVDKKAKSRVIIGAAIPGNCRIRKKEIEKIEKYQNLKRERVEKTLTAEKGSGCTSGCRSFGMH